MEINPSQDPIKLFKEWLKKAEETEPLNPNAMSLATVGDNSMPSVRMVLLKTADKTGFYFYTNMKSRKALELKNNPNVALCFYWKSQDRQVRVEGSAEIIPAPIVDAYFKSRHYLSRIGAWASRQSEKLNSRKELEDKIEYYKDKFEGKEIIRPPHWAGYRVIPKNIEFWEQGEARLHDRFLFTKHGISWNMSRLNP